MCTRTTYTVQTLSAERCLISSFHLFIIAIGRIMVYPYIAEYIYIYILYIYYKVPRWLRVWMNVGTAD